MIDRIVQLIQIIKKMSTTANVPDLTTIETKDNYLWSWRAAAPGNNDVTSSPACQFYMNNQLLQMQRQGSRTEFPVLPPPGSTQNVQMTNGALALTPLAKKRMSLSFTANYSSPSYNQTKSDIWSTLATTPARNRINKLTKDCNELLN